MKYLILLTALFLTACDMDKEYGVACVNGQKYVRMNMYGSIYEPTGKPCIVIK